MRHVLNMCHQINKTHSAKHFGKIIYQTKKSIKYMYIIIAVNINTIMIQISTFTTKFSHPVEFLLGGIRSLHFIN